MIRPAGKNAPYIDPKPILDGWKLLEATAVYRAAGVNPFFGQHAKNASIGQILLMCKEQLQNRVLADPHVQIYACGRRDIQAGQIDRRVLAVIEFLSGSGLDPTVSGLECGASATGQSGVDSAGSSGSSRRLLEDQQHPGPGPPGQRLDHRPHDPAAADPPGHLQARPDRLHDELQGPDEHARRCPTTPTGSRSPTRRYSGPTRRSRRRSRNLLKPGQWLRLINHLEPDPRAGRPDRAQQVRDQGRRAPL